MSLDKIIPGLGLAAIIGVTVLSFIGTFYFAAAFIAYSSVFNLVMMTISLVVMACISFWMKHSVGGI